MKNKKIYNLIFFMLVIPLFVLGLYFFTPTKTQAEASVKTYTYTFEYLEEYWVEDAKELYGENVLINATNDIIEKNNNGWAIADIAKDYWCTMNYGEFSNDYYLIWRTKEIKVPEGQFPNMNLIRSDFNCFYNIFTYWQPIGSNKAYSSANLPKAEKDLKFKANYEIKKKILLDADDEHLLTFYPRNYAEIEMESKTVKGKTVYFYTFDLETFKNKSEGYYKYTLFKNIEIKSGSLKISPININKDDLVLELHSQFKDQNQFNSYRTQFTKKNYRADLGNMFVDMWTSLTGNDGILDSTISTISSAGTIAAGTSKVIANGAESLADSIWIFADFTSNFKSTLVYIILIAIVCVIAVFVLRFIFWFINSVKNTVKKGVNKNV